ncbi:MAG: hypothetical protein E6662_09445 [Pantoea sp.]|nr:hypothetical protein [Pantoea sp.]
MITGIQITQTNNPDLMHSFWLIDDEKAEARCLCAISTADDSRFRLRGALQRPDAGTAA